ncbi:MAG: hypothetical protein WDZ53_06275, partial [Balneolales bacterium]
MNNKKRPPSNPPVLSRRDLLRSTAALSTAMVAGMTIPKQILAAGDPAAKPAPRNNRIKQDLVSWTYMGFGDNWSLDQLCQNAVELGCGGIELVGPDEWPVMQKYGLTCPLATNGMPDPPFEKGLNNPRYQDEVITRTKARIEACSEAGMPAVIAFTGFKYLDVANPRLGEIPP